jgi:hypothetical protein
MKGGMRSPVSRGTHSGLDVYDVPYKSNPIKGLKEKLAQFKKKDPYSLAILGGIQFKPTYQGKHRGGFKSNDIKKRRAHNKVARQQRRINRG